MLNMLYLTKNTAARLQPQQLCSRKQNVGRVSYFIAEQDFAAPLRRRIKINKMRRNC